MLAQAPASPIRAQVRSFLRHRLAEHELPHEAICRSCGGQGFVRVERPRSAKTNERDVSLDELERHIVTIETRLQEIDDELGKIQTLRDGNQCRFLKRQRQRLAIELKPLDNEWRRRAATRVVEEIEGQPTAGPDGGGPERPEQRECSVCRGLGIRPPVDSEPALTRPPAIGTRGCPRADRDFVARAIQLLQAYEADTPRGAPRDLVDRLLRVIDDDDAKTPRGRLDVVGNIGLVAAAILLAWGMVRLLVRIL